MRFLPVLSLRRLPHGQSLLSAARLHGRGAGPPPAPSCGVSSHVCQESPFKDMLSPALDCWGRPHLGHEGERTAGRPLRDVGTSSPAPAPAVNPPALHLLKQPKPATKELGPHFPLDAKTF